MEPLSETDFRKLAGFLQDYPAVPLRVYGHYGLQVDLGFLRHFPFLLGFQEDLYDLSSLDGLAHLPGSLEFLALGATRRKLSLKPIARFTHLRDLCLEGHTKDFPVVGGFEELVSLTLRSISLPDLSPLLPLCKLRSLAIKLGGTRDLSLLPKVGRLRYLELWMIRGLGDLDAIQELEALRCLFLQDLRQVKALPSFRRLAGLHRCHIESLKGLSDLSPVAQAPNLEELLVVGMNHLKPEDLTCFRGHPRLRAVCVGLGSLSRNAAAEALLALPRLSYSKSIEEYVEDRPGS